MNARTRQRPAGTGREVEQQIELAAQLYGTTHAEATARDGYTGTTPPKAAPMPRDPLTIAGELYQAAECLADLAEDFAAGVFDARALSSADALLVGCGRLVCELRQRQGVRA